MPYESTEILLWEKNMNKLKSVFCKLRVVGLAMLRGLSPTFSRFSVKNVLLESSTICIYIAHTLTPTKARIAKYSPVRVCVCVCMNLFISVSSISVSCPNCPGNFKADSLLFLFNLSGLYNSASDRNKSPKFPYSRRRNPSGGSENESGQPVRRR